MPIPPLSVEPIDQRPQLRVAAAIALASAFCLLPLQALAVGAGQLPTLFLIYGLHTAVAGFVLMASFTGLGARRGDGLGLLFVLGLGANLLLYLYLLPFAVPTYPSLMARAFTTLLITGAVLFSWSMRRTILVGVLVCAGFALVGVALGRRGFPMPPFVGPLSWIAIGAALAVACARVLGRFRTSLIQRQDELAALSTRLISVQEEQLRRLSRELHDELGQSLTAVSSYLWLLERKLPPDLGELRARAGEARHLVAKTLGEMRELSQLLRPPGLDLYGLARGAHRGLPRTAPDRDQVHRRGAPGAPAGGDRDGGLPHHPGGAHQRRPTRAREARVGGSHREGRRAQARGARRWRRAAGGQRGEPPERHRAHRHPRARARARRDGLALLGTGRRRLPARQRAAAGRGRRRTDAERAPASSPAMSEGGRPAGRPPSSHARSADDQKDVGDGVEAHQGEVSLAGRAVRPASGRAART